MRLMLAAALCLAFTLPAQAEPIPVKFGVIGANSRTIGNLPYAIAQRKGYFARENLAVQVVGLAGVENQVEALDKSEVDIVHTATPYLVQAVLKGSDAVGVIGGAKNNLLTLLAKPELKTYADLKGKVVGMSLPQDTITIATRMLLRKHGLKDTDYKTVDRIGPLRTQCLVQGECDAAAANQPTDIELMAKGYNRMGDSLEVVPVLQFNMLAVRRAWGKEHKDIVVRFARAMGSSYQFMRDPKTRDEVVALIADISGTRPDIARQMLTLYFDPDKGIMPKQAELSEEGVAKVIALLVESGELKGPAPDAVRFIDVQYLKDAGLQ